MAKNLNVNDVNKVEYRDSLDSIMISNHRIRVMIMSNKHYYYSIWSHVYNKADIFDSS